MLELALVGLVLFALRKPTGPQQQQQQQAPPPASPPSSGGGGGGGLDLGALVGTGASVLGTVGGAIATFGGGGAAVGGGTAGAAAAGGTAAGGGTAASSSATGGTVAATAGVSAGSVAGIAVAIAVVVVLTVTAIERGVRDADFVSKSIDKGQSGLRADLVDFALRIAGTAQEKLGRAQALILGVGVALAYNQCMRLAVRLIPRGVGASDEAHDAYWAERAMFLVDESGFEAEALAAFGVPMNEYVQVQASQLDHARALGSAMGKLLTCWLFARKKMLEPWHYDWLAKAYGEGFNFGIGDWLAAGGGARLFVNAGVPGLVWNVPPESGLIPPEGLVTYALPFEINWNASSPSNFALQVTPGFEDSLNAPPPYMAPVTPEPARSGSITPQSLVTVVRVPTQADTAPSSPAAGIGGLYGNPSSSPGNVFGNVQTPPGAPAPLPQVTQLTPTSSTVSRSPSISSRYAARRS